MPRPIVVALVCVCCAVALLRAQSAPPPAILVVINDSAPNPFGRYLVEILRTEGLTDVGVVSLASLDTAKLTGARLVLLAETPVGAATVSLLNDFVADGGRLVAMRPAAALQPLFGIAPAGGSTTDGRVLIDQGGPGGGLATVTLPYRGTADHYTLAGATSVAAMPSGWPAVVRKARTAAWAFDLARSTVMTRQGDPALAGLDRDGLPVVRTNDVFFGQIDLARTRVPHADVHMRLLTRVITALLADVQPVPRLWYFPGTARTLVVNTADSHTGVLSRYTTLLSAAQTYGAQLTLYLGRYITLPQATVDAWRAAGHEVSLHPYFFEDSATVAQGYATAFGWFEPLFGTPGPTVRHHTVEWAGWIDPVEEMVRRGIRMDTSFYTWGPAVYNPDAQTQVYGYITGSGLPMRFVDEAGVVRPVYQQVTALIDEQLVLPGFAGSQQLTPAQGLAVSRALMDESQAGGHSAIVTQFHVDHYTALPESQPWVDGTMAYAASLGIPMWSAERWLRFTEARAATAVGSVTWSAVRGELSFAVSVPAGAEPQTVLLPDSFAGAPLGQVTLDGVVAPSAPFTVHGEALAAVVVSGGGATREVRARYGSGVPPTVSVQDQQVVEGTGAPTLVRVPVVLSEPADAAVSIQFATAGGTATAGVDYTAATGTLVFPQGTTVQYAEVTVAADAAHEDAETVQLVLSSPSDCTIADGVAILTIEDDDARPALSVTGGSVAEGTGAGAQAVVTVSLSAASPTVVTVAYATEDGTARAGEDYVATSGTLSFGPGETARTVSVPITGDALDESDETVTLRLGAATNAVVAVPTAVVTIVDDDGPVAPPYDFRVAVVSGGTVTFRWQPPAGVGPSGYRLDAGLAPGATFVSLPVPASPPILTLPVPPGVFYVRLRAVLGGVESAPSGEVVVRTGETAAPSPPDRVLAAVRGGALDLSWRATFAGGVPAAYDLDVAGSVSASLPLGPGEAVSFPQVPPGTYQLTLRARNAAGRSAPASPLTVAVPGTCAAPPAPPTDLTGTVSGGRVTVTWEPPSSGTAATSYEIAVAGLGAFGTPARTVTGALPPGRYALSVRSLGPCGASAPSASVWLEIP